PKERAFLIQLSKLADENVIFEHWSDLDYGGIRIFQFIKNKIFPTVKPLHMDASIYEQLYSKGIEGTVLTESKRKKLEKIEAGELDELKQCILRYGKEFEQEALIGVIDE
ncbi:MAG: Wadjet anti-phage system protein JetD domain-containing protein, partial [Coprococcus sp.]